MGNWISTPVPPQYSANPFKSPRQIRILELLPPSRECKQSPNPGSALDPVQGKLLLRSLDDAGAPQFTALSYVWGDASQTTNIEVDGKPLIITKTLETALRALRNDRSSLLLWVDQICINQLDDDEKDLQVPLMKDIYTIAAETIAWMGEPSSDSEIEKVLGYLQRLGRGLTSLGFTHISQELYTKLTANDEVESLGVVTVDDETRAMKHGITQILDGEAPWHSLDILPALNKFFDLPYFQRGWIKQEVALPKNLTFRCGKNLINAETLYAGIQMHHLHWHYTLRRTRQQLRRDGRVPEAHVRQTLLADQPGFDTANATMNLRMRYQGKRWGLPMTLGGVLRKFRSLPKFTNAKDRIYGVLGLATDAATLDLPPMSNREVTVEKLYAAASKHIIQSGDVNFLLHACRSGNGCGNPSQIRRFTLSVVSVLLNALSILPSWFPKAPLSLRKFLLRSLPPDLSIPSGLPSWAPDFRNMSSQALIADLSLSAPKPFAAGTLPRDVSEDRQKSIDPSVLILEGIVLDKIGVVGTPWTNEHSSNEFKALNAYLPLRDFRDLVEASHRILEQNPYHPLWADEQQRARRMEAVWRVPVADHESIGDALFNSQRATVERSGRGYVELYRSLQLSYAVMVQNSKVDITKLDADVERQLEAEGLERGELDMRRVQLLAEKTQVGPLGANYLGALGLFETRRAFLSLTGFVGFGPTTMQCGDMVCIVFGAQVPVALRPLGNDRYLFIGEVYCDGVMDGEALQWGKEKRTFYLC